MAPGDRVATGPDTGQFAWLREPRRDEIGKDGPFEVYDQERGGKVTFWWYNSVGLVPVGTQPQDAPRLGPVMSATTLRGGSAP
jgi:hypothetical protein